VYHVGCSIELMMVKLPVGLGEFGAPTAVSKIHHPVVLDHGQLPVRDADHDPAGHLRLVILGHRFSARPENHARQLHHLLPHLFLLPTTAEKDAGTAPIAK